jgi:hypothetical protein
MTTIDEADLKAAHKASAHHRSLVEKAIKCGCFYCISIFEPTDFDDDAHWIAEADEDLATALCPNCGVDAVIPDNAGFPITLEFLRGMNDYYFQKRALGEP